MEHKTSLAQRFLAIAGSEQIGGILASLNESGIFCLSLLIAAMVGLIASPGALFWLRQRRQEKIHERERRLILTYIDAIRGDATAQLNALEEHLRAIQEDINGKRDGER